MHSTMIVPTRVAEERTTTHRRRKTTDNRSTYLTHVDGLRGLAIMLVVVFHVFIGKVSSGVDVFLFLGGMFLLRSQVKNFLYPNGLSLSQTIIRLMRRLYPALITVVFITGAAGMFIYPGAKKEELLQDIAASVTYWINIRLWSEGNSYANAQNDPSMFQHLWSMAVQIQIYLSIILLVFLFGIVRKRLEGDPKKYEKIINAVIIIATVCSFIYAQWLNHHDQSLNYYSPLSRFWEIGAGALFGSLLLKHLVFSPQLRWLLSIVGLLMILFTGVFLDGAHQFPGAWALVPIVGAALVVSVGQSSASEERDWSHMGIIRALDSSYAREMGKISYSLYLWHWPLLILCITSMDDKKITWWMGILIIISSLILAELTYHFIETPLRQSSKPVPATLMQMLKWDHLMRSLRNTPTLFHPISAVALVIVAVLLASSPYVYKVNSDIQARKTAQWIEQRGGVDALYPGAAEFLAHVPVDDDLPILPDPNNPDDMMPQTQVDKCFTDFPDRDLVLTKPDGSPCLYGDVSSDKRMYVFGGSHSEQYMPALEEIGKKRGFAILPIIKVGCAPYQEKLWDGSDYPQCSEWTDKAMKYIMDNPPNMGVFMTGSRPTEITGKGPEVVPQGYINVVRALSDKGIESWLIRDNPWMMNEDSSAQVNSRVCISEGKTRDECSQPWTRTMADIDPQIEAYKGIPHVRIMDLSRAYTNNGIVYPVVGGLLSYRDSHHFTRQFAATMTNFMDSLMFPSPEIIPNPAAEEYIVEEPAPVPFMDPEAGSIEELSPITSL